MASKYDSDRTIGKVIRSICGDILEDFDESVLNELFADENGTLSDLGKKYKKWIFNISAFIQNREKKQTYLGFLIFVMLPKKLDPSKYKFWKSLMALEMPLEFFEMFDSIDTQIPRLASRNLSGDKDKTKKEDDKWFMPG